MISYLKRYFPLGNKGQSLVEAAMFLPILIFILAGVVEVSNLLITQNKVTTASRIGAGFGAANFQPNDWPTTADAMGDVTVDTVTDTLELNGDLWDVWSIHALTNISGTDFATFESQHVYGNHAVISTTDWITLEQEIRTDMLAELQSVGITNTKDLEVVASVPFHNIDTILGLPIWQWTGMQTIRGLTVMRVGQKAAFTGCPILPITIHFEQYSLYPTNWPDDLQGPWNAGLYPDYPNPVVEQFPDSFGSQMTVPPPPYTNTVDAPSLETDYYGSNRPGTPLEYAKPGDIYWAREQDAPGGFGWLTWRGGPDLPALDDSLAFPGDFMSPTTGYPTSPADRNLIANGIYGPTGDDDTVLEPYEDGVHPGEWLESASGNMNVARDRIQEYIDDRRRPTLLVYDYDNGLSGSNLNYHVVGFMRVKVVGYKFQGADKWIVFEVVQWPAQNCPGG